MAQEMKDQTRRAYESPKLTAVTFRAEKGYASSTLFDQLFFWAWDAEGGVAAGNGNNVEVYETGNGWNEGSNHFWD